MDTADLIAAIRKAFDGTPRSSTSLRQFWLTDQYGMSREITDQEWRDAGRRRSDSNWQEIPDSEIKECGVLLAHMQAPEFQYFLPAYMLFGLNELAADPGRSKVIGSVMFSLYPSKRDSSLRAYTLSQLSLLTRDQRQAAVDYLRFVATHGDDFDRPNATKALERFWTQEILDRGIETSITQKP